MKMVYSLSFIFSFFFLYNINAQNLIKNGNFEENLANWNSNGYVFITTSQHSSGLKSLAVSTTTSEKGFVYQQLNFPTKSFNSIFWFLPESSQYDSKLEFVANWISPIADFIARIEFNQDSIHFTALDADTTIKNTMHLGQWNKIEIMTDSSGITKMFYINDTLKSALTSSVNMPIETLILGDVSDNIGFGTLYYDNISVVPGNNQGEVFPSYVQGPFDPIICNSLSPERKVFFDISSYSIVDSIKLVYGYVNFDRIGGDYPASVPDKVSFEVQLGKFIIDNVRDATNSTRLKRQVNITPTSDIFEVDFRYTGGGNSVEFVRPVLMVTTSTVTGIKKQEIIPAKYKLDQNYPNPFNPTTNIRYSITQSGKVKIEVYNNLGQKVRTLVNRYETAGDYSSIWDGLNDQGEKVASGVYMYRLSVNNFSIVKKMILLK